MGLPLIAAIAVAAVVLSGGGDGATSPASDGRQQGSGNGGGAQTAQLGTPALGSEDAPVVLTEYSDYQ